MCGLRGPIPPAGLRFLVARRRASRRTMGASSEETHAMTSGRPAALHIIHDEHRALAAMLNALKLLADDVRRSGRAPDFDLIRAILFYIDEFPERLHHAKESEVLFPLLRQRAPQAIADLNRIDADHARGERSIRELEHLLLGYEQLGESRRDRFLEALDRYIAFYLEHMVLEEQHLLPLAESALTATTGRRWIGRSPRTATR
jgi:hemerythrin-like domain-containing protein